ncbi:MAG TPA: SIR2 family protein [Ignavibacteriaceae bacterium]|nr:SIR2 family protein [Ignavibacteriaceae bacterium]
MTKEIAIKAISEFFTSNPNPLVIFGTGISCSLDNKFGMGELKKELEAKIPAKILGKKEQENEWNKVLGALKKGKDLESSLDFVLDEELIRTIIGITGNLISNLDKQYMIEILNGTAVWPASDFIKKLVNGLPESDPTLSLITPNYDMLAEYAFEKREIKYINGFSGSFIRRIDWDQSSKCIQHLEKIPYNKRFKNIKKIEKHIEIHKVHGSLNAFYYNDEVVEVNTWLHDPPVFAERVIITPGISKYKRISEFRTELLKNADQVVKKKDAFIFIGYGFNDKHIEQYLIPKITKQDCPCLVITRDNNERIEEILKKSKNLWLICKQESNDFTRIKNSAYTDWLYLDNKRLWNISEFTKEIIGD